ncbi:hypothetical protein B484DRAFT_453785 [Ochromonadaceae sp. CCMP2298]|nr:hypothetical protein B484DRAFT_453785 [Ochromonadaceae sp. CCMP2298]
MRCCRTGQRMWVQRTKWRYRSRPPPSTRGLGSCTARDVGQPAPRRGRSVGVRAHARPPRPDDGGARHHPHHLRGCNDDGHRHPRHRAPAPAPPVRAHHAAGVPEGRDRVAGVSLPARPPPLPRPDGRALQALTCCPHGGPHALLRVLGPPSSTCQHPRTPSRRRLLHLAHALSGYHQVGARAPGRTLGPVQRRRPVPHAPPPLVGHTQVPRDPRQPSQHRADARGPRRPTTALSQLQRHRHTQRAR